MTPQALFAADLTSTTYPPGVAVIDYTSPFTAATPARLKRAGVGVAIRYVGNSKWKSLTRSEANALRNAGIDIAAVYETNATWMLGGRAAGVSAAKTARAAIIGCGGPKTPFVYFACDVDTHNYSAVNACLKGAASVLGADHVGIYGSFSVCSSALQSGYATKTWQTEAWSSGKVMPKATLYQRAHSIDGDLALNYDSNLVRADDIGQWGYTTPGVTWAAQSTPTSATLNSVDFAGSSVGWAVGDDGTVIHTGDGGGSWGAQSTPATATLNSVRFIDASSGWAVGETGTVIHTTDGGATWAAQPTSTTATLRSVAFPDDNAGWAVGDDGTMLHTADGGSTWAPQSTPATATLTSVDFTDGITGWAVGAAGTVLRTASAGGTWTVQSTPTTATLSSVDFVDSHNGWAVGSAGTILRTANGGATWNPQSAPTTATLTSVRFTDTSNGCAVGEAGTILCTTNGGSIWVAQSSPTTATLLSADMTDWHTGWAVGSSGVIVHGTGTGLSPFGTISGVVTDAVSGAPISGLSISVGSRLAAPTATDGTFIAARLAPGTYKVSFSSPRYITGSVTGVAVVAAGRTTFKVKLAPRAATSLSKPSAAVATPVHTQPTTLTVTLSPPAAATSGATTLYGTHYEQKTVTVKVQVKVKGKTTTTTKKVKVWYWRSRFTLRMSAQGAGVLQVRTTLAAGKWRMQAKFAGSGTFLPSTSATRSFTVN